MTTVRTDPPTGATGHPGTAGRGDPRLPGPTRPGRDDGRGRLDGRSLLRRAPRPARYLGYAALFAFALFYLLPFAIQVVTCFKTDPDAAAHPLSLIPDPFSWRPTAPLRQRRHLGAVRALAGQLGPRDACITAGRVFIDSVAGYALARLRFRGRTVLFAFVIAVMAVPGVVLLIPKFLVLTPWASSTPTPA